MPPEFLPLFVVGSAVLGGLYLLVVVFDRKRDLSDVLDGYENLLDQYKNPPPPPAASPPRDGENPPLVR
jgi:hypothetical protein